MNALERAMQTNHVARENAIARSQTLKQDVHGVHHVVDIIWVHGRVGNRPHVL